MEGVETGQECLTLVSYKHYPEAVSFCKGRAFIYVEVVAITVVKITFSIWKAMDCLLGFVGSFCAFVALYCFTKMTSVLVKTK